MFTDRTLRQLRVTKEQFIADGQGLYVRATPRGKKTFVFRSQKGGRSRWRVIGHYPATSLLEARNRAAKAQERGFLVPTVAEAYREYLPRIREHYKHSGEIERRFNRDILPPIEIKPVDAVSRKDCSDILQTIVNRGSRVAANRTLPDIKQFFAYCLERGWRNDNPADGITRRSAGGRESPKRRSLKADELALLFKRLLGRHMALRTKLILGLLLTTGTRTSEVLGVTPGEIAKYWWIIPSERTKNGREHKVYLSPQSRRLMRSSFKYFGSNPFKNVLRNSISNTVRRLPLQPKASPHKFRHTMATMLTDLGVAPHVTEKMLNHKLEGVFEVYNHAEFLPERRAAWRLWGVYLAKLRRKANESLVKASNVRGSVVRAARTGNALDAVHLRSVGSADGSLAPNRGTVPPLLVHKETP